VPLSEREISRTKNGTAGPGLVRFVRASRRMARAGEAILVRRSGNH
jgi:hypothetical protein